MPATIHAYHEGDEPIPGTGYRLISFLGRGGFGEVWKASTPGGVEAAIKIIRLGGAEGRKEFRALQLVKRIRHPNLMPLAAFWLKSADGAVLDNALAGQPELSNLSTIDEAISETTLVPMNTALAAPAELIIVMGLGDKPLIDRLDECRAQGCEGIPTEELLGYMEDAAEALDFLNSPVHGGGDGPIAIQHCDIKPHNLMIVGGAVQVCDFGLARMMGVERVTTGAASIAYAAPELLEGNKISSSTDQYSLAITYYELRSGKLPYSKETLAAVLEAKQTDTLDFSVCPMAEQEVLRRATRRDPVARFPSSLEFIRALRRAATADAEQGRTVSPRSPRRRARKAIAWGLIASICGAIASAGWWQFGRPEHVMPPAAVENTEPTSKTTSASLESKFKEPKRPEQKPSEPKPPAPVVSAGTSTPPPVKGPLEKGDELLKAGKYKEAILELDQAAVLAPNDARAFSRRGFARFQLKEYPNAIEDFKHSIDLAPTATDHFNRGLCYVKMKRCDEAIEDFDAAIRLDPQYAAAYYSRSQCHLKKEEYEAVVVDATKAIELFKTSSEPGFALADAYVLRGAACHEGLGRDKEALEDAKKALALSPADPIPAKELYQAALEALNEAAGKKKAK